MQPNLEDPLNPQLTELTFRLLYHSYIKFRTFQKSSLLYPRVENLLDLCLRVGFGSSIDGISQKNDNADVQSDTLQVPGYEMYAHPDEEDWSKMKV